MLNRFTKLQISALSSLILDIGKLFFGSVVVGFFIPSLNVPFTAFMIGVISSLLMFFFGISIIKLTEGQ